MSTSSLPSYAHTDIPAYTIEPGDNERTLGRTHAPHPGQVGNWVKRGANATLALAGQSSSSELPVYGRNTTIEGSVTLASTEHITKVQVKIGAYAKCRTIAEIGEELWSILDETFVLWQQVGGSGVPASCPAELPFEIPLPSKCTLDGQSTPLPPSFEYLFSDVQGGTPNLKAKIKYEITVNVETTQLLKLSSPLTTEFIYLPRSRPPRSMGTAANAVFETEMETRVGGPALPEPIVWKLQLPGSGIYSITDTIPFRVTVTSRSSRLLAPFAPSKAKVGAAIRVYFLRRVSIKVHGVDLWRSFVAGEGKLQPVPLRDDDVWLRMPASPARGRNGTSGGSRGSSTGSETEREGWAAYDWDGTLAVDRARVSQGTFSVGGMVIKDFIILSVVPPNPRLGNLLEVKQVVPVALTTDGWGDEHANANSEPVPDEPPHERPVTLPELRFDYN